MNSFLFLGTGPSTGVPVIGCKCRVCISNKERLRPSGLLKIGPKTILIDAGPDFRQQALTHQIDHLDGLILTHTHYDHIAGIDELRSYYLQTETPLPCLLSQMSFNELKLRYYYLFEKRSEKKTLSAQLDCKILPQKAGIENFLGVKISYFSYFQGEMQVTGLRIGNFAYVSDIRSYDDSIFKSLLGIETLVVSALRLESALMMFSIDEAIQFGQKAKAKKIWLTHMNHEIDYDLVNQELPQGVQLAYDGLEIDIGEI